MKVSRTDDVGVGSVLVLNNDDVFIVTQRNGDDVSGLMYPSDGRNAVSASIHLPGYAKAIKSIWSSIRDIPTI